ncbi:carbohydrate ABC transporter permease [Treponema primitia]|uniref:carbohydrate ABC transporter permease n=1 Tax=Treponema primitia TaxID=88058 RepID=UPI000255503E|nr:carbohydrate ABC transporter permease [Treponema primitia]
MKPRSIAQTKTVLTYVALVLIILVVDFPFFQMVSVSFKTRQEALGSTKFFPQQISLDNIIRVWTHTDFPHNILNSLIVAVSSTICCIVIAIIAGYALSRFRGKVFSAYSVLLLLLQLFPSILLLIPLFVIFTKLGLVDTLFSCILAYTTTNLAFSIWMIKGFIDSIPFDLEEAGMIDGCTQFSAFTRLIIPISMPGISTVGIFTFINSWGEYTLASILLRSDSNITLTLGLQKFVMQFTSDWPSLMTASTIATLPTIVFLVFAQKYLVRGMSAGAVKG